MTALEKITRLSSELDRRKAIVELVRELKQMLQTTGFFLRKSQLGKSFYN